MSDLNELYAGLDDIDFLRRPTSTDWSDQLVIARPGIRLHNFTYQDLKAQCQLGVDALSVQMTRRGAATILNLAWNLRSESDPRLRVWPDDQPGGVGLEIDDLSSDPIFDNTLGQRKVIRFEHETVTGGAERNWEMIRQICYLCASLLKLFSKRAESWSGAKHHLANQYQKFTGHRMTLATDMVRTECLHSLERLFKMDKDFVYTLGNFLYCVEELESGREMTKMLFEKHLGFAGMHIVSLMSRAIEGLGVGRDEMLAVLRCRMYADTLGQLEELMSGFMESTSPSRERKTYQYARLFDSDMFSLLQTKYCVELVCMLAHLCKLLGSNDDILSIAALGELSDSRKQFCSRAAQNILRHFESK